MNFKSDSPLRKSFLKYLALKERYDEIKALKTDAEKIFSKLTKQKDFPQIVEAWKKLSYYGYSWSTFDEIESMLLAISMDSMPKMKSHKFLKSHLEQVDKDLKNLQNEMITTKAEFEVAFVESYETFVGKNFKKNGAFMTSVMKMPSTEKFFIDFMLS